MTFGLLERSITWLCAIAIFIWFIILIEMLWDLWQIVKDSERRDDDSTR